MVDLPDSAETEDGFATDVINFDNPYLTLAGSVRDQFVEWVKHNAELIHGETGTDAAAAIAGLDDIDMSNFIDDGFEFAKLFKGQDGLSSLFEFEEHPYPWDNGLNMSGVVWYLSAYHSSATASFWHDPTTNNEDGMPSLGQWAHFREAQESFAKTWRIFCSICMLLLIAMKKATVQLLTLIMTIMQFSLVQFIIFTEQSNPRRACRIPYGH